MSFERNVTTREGNLQIPLLVEFINTTYPELAFQGLAMGNPDTTFYFENEPSEEQWTAIQAFYATLPEVAPKPKDVFRIYDLVDPRFVDLAPHLIDFRRHLKEGLSLQKDVVFAKNKRPLYANYTYVYGENPPIFVARLRWTFEDNAQGLMTRRVEEISYVQNGEGDVLGPYFTKLDQSFNIVASEYHRAQVLQERVQARQAILEDVKLVVMNVLTTAMPDAPIQDVYNVGGAFWREHSNALDSFVQVSDQTFRDVELPAASSVTYPWLEAEIAPSITLRAWIIDRLTY
jgi:hypothetical protein